MTNWQEVGTGLMPVLLLYCCSYCTANHSSDGEVQASTRPSLPEHQTHCRAPPAPPTHPSPTHPPAHTPHLPQKLTLDKDGRPTLLCHSLDNHRPCLLHPVRPPFSPPPQKLTDDVFRTCLKSGDYMQMKNALLVLNRCVKVGGPMQSWLLLCPLGLGLGWLGLTRSPYRADQELHSALCLWPCILGALSSQRPSWQCLHYVPALPYLTFCQARKGRPGVL